VLRLVAVVFVHVGVILRNLFVFGRTKYPTTNCRTTTTPTHARTTPTSPKKRHTTRAAHEYISSRGSGGRLFTETVSCSHRYAATFSRQHRVGYSKSLADLWVLFDFTSSGTTSGSACCWRLMHHRTLTLTCHSRRMRI
jgi:hypothetical protein